MTFETHSAQETEALGKRLAAALPGGGVVAMFGGLGMGKTAFVRGMAQHICPDAEVSSPTFALVQDYGGRPPLVHFDMYRIESWDDLYSIGYFDYLSSGGILAVEWSENIGEALEENTIYIEIENLGDNKRNIKINR